MRSPIFAVKTMQDFLIEQRWPFRVSARYSPSSPDCFGAFFGGIYAVMAYSVSRVRRRSGYGWPWGRPPGCAAPVLSLVLKQLAIGLVAGLAAAFGLTRVPQLATREDLVTDPPTFAGISLLLTVVGAVGLLDTGAQSYQDRPDGCAAVRVKTWSGSGPLVTPVC